MIRKKAVIKARTSSHQTVDMAFHPQLSMAHGERFMILYVCGPVSELCLAGGV